MITIYFELLLMILVDVYNKCTTWSKIDTISYYMNRKFQNYILYILYEEKKYTINILYFFCFGVVSLDIYQKYQAFSTIQGCQHITNNGNILLEDILIKIKFFVNKNSHYFA